MNKQELILLIKECIQEIAPTKLSKVANVPSSRIDMLMKQFLVGVYGNPPKTDDLEKIQDWANVKLLPARNGVIVDFKLGKFRHNLKDNYAGTPDSDEVDVYVYFDPKAGLRTVQDAINDTFPPEEEKPLFVFWLSPEYVANTVLGEDIANRIVVPGCNQDL